MLKAGSLAMTHYAVLGVPENADAEAIHNAYRARARQYHPDAGEGSSAGKFREIAEAYETLSDPARRAAYDAVLARERSPRPSFVTHDVVVEPLAQPWVSMRTSPLRSAPVISIDEWFEETFRAFHELFPYRWFDPW
jgi:curved DNA-binding protein CbpA